MNTKLVAIVLGLIVLGAGLMFGDTVGNAVIGRSYLDTCDGCSFALATPFAPDSGALSTWSFYAGTTGLAITPILYTMTGGNFTIVGIGTTRTVSSLGVNTDPFGLVAGTDAITGSNFYFGYRDGGVSLASGNAGTVSIDNSVTGTLMYYFGNGAPSPVNVGISVGQLMVQGDLGVGGTGLLDRNYSISATAAIPEPATMVFMGLGLLALGLRARRVSRP